MKVVVDCFVDEEIAMVDWVGVDSCIVVATGRGTTTTSTWGTIRVVIDSSGNWVDYTIQGTTADWWVDVDEADWWVDVDVDEVVCIPYIHHSSGCWYATQVDHPSCLYFYSSSSCEPTRFHHRSTPSPYHQPPHRIDWMRRTLSFFCVRCNEYFISIYK